MAGFQVKDMALGNSPTPVPGMAQHCCWPKLRSEKRDPCTTTVHERNLEVSHLLDGAGRAYAS